MRVSGEHVARVCSIYFILLCLFVFKIDIMRAVKELGPLQ